MYLPREQSHAALQRFPIDLYLCSDCGYAHLRDVIDPDSIYRDYVYTTSSSPGLLSHFERYAQQVVSRLHPESGSLVVDIGSNDGALLQSFRRLGFRVVGVEPAHAIAEHAERAGVTTLCRYFDAQAVRAILALHGAATIITANNVFANIDDLSGVVENVKCLLAPGGVFVIEFAYLADLVGNRIFDYIYHEHLSYFSVGALKRYFERAEMTVIAAEHVQTKGGSVRLYVQRKEDRHPFIDSLAEWIAGEERLRLRDPETYRALDNEVRAVRQKCRQALAALRAKEQRIVGYGASITCTTLIYHFGLVDFLDFLVDDNERKIGTICPGTGLEVRPPSELYTPAPSAVIVLAWRFADMIIERNKRFLDRGGVFVVPMPKVAVINADGTALFPQNE